MVALTKKLKLMALAPKGSDKHLKKPSFLEKLGIDPLLIGAPYQKSLSQWH